MEISCLVLPIFRKIFQIWVNYGIFRPCIEDSVVDLPLYYGRWLRAVLTTHLDKYCPHSLWTCRLKR